MSELRSVQYDPEVSLKDVQDIWTIKALEHSGGNVINAARQLGVSRSTLHRRLKEITKKEMSRPYGEVLNG